jgi:TctA family transporter
LGSLGAGVFFLPVFPYKSLAPLFTGLFDVCYRFCAFSSKKSSHIISVFFMRGLSTN